MKTSLWNNYWQFQNKKIREATTSGNTEAEATVYVLNADPALTMAIINAKKAAKST